MRNAQLEEQSSAVPTLRADLDATAKRVELLLVLLGEKEEELEAMMGDMKEVKHMYRAHMEELIEKCSPPSPPPPSNGTADDKNKNNSKLAVSEQSVPKE